MKKNILFIFLLVLIIGFSLDSGAKAISQLDDEEIIAENAHLILYMNRESTSLAIQCKETGTVWLTNPAGSSQARAGLRERMSSQINIIHDPNGVTKDNYTFSNQFDTLRITLIDDGVRVDYQFVERWSDTDYLPWLSSADRFEELILNQLQDRDKESIRSNYWMIELRALDEDEEHPEIFGLPMEEIYPGYTIEILEDNYQETKQELEQLELELLEVTSLGDEAEISNIESKIASLERDLLWELEDIAWHLTDLFIDNRADLDRIEDLTIDDVSQLIDTPTYMRKNIPRFSLGNLSKIVESIGYSPIDATEDHILNNINPSVPNLEIFELPIEYRLEGKSFIVTIPVDEIHYPQAVMDFAGEEHSFPITFLEVLPYFSAADLDDDGYIFVPDGSGALIYLNNGKLFSRTYNQSVYGQDYTEDPPNYKTSFIEQIHLPVFGLKKGDQAFLGIIEKGDAIAHLRADISERRDDYNRVFPRFNINKSGKIYLDHGGDLDVYQPVMYQGDIQIRYEFFSGEDANYSEMAKRYQEYLVGTNVLQPLDKGTPPFLIDIIGAFPRQEIRFGLPRNVYYPATSFEEVADIFNILTHEGIENIHLRYRGWLKGGLTHYYPQKAIIEKSLGSEMGFKELIQYIQDNDGTIYPDVGFLNVFRERLFDGFSSSRHAARNLNRLPARFYSYNAATFAQENAKARYVVSPQVLKTVVPSFMDDFTKFGSESIALNQIGWQLNSDFRHGTGAMVDRQHASEIISSQLESISRDYKIMIEGGNVYNWPYASMMVNVPLEDSGYDIVDQRIPFYQMVVSGYKTYAGPALNHVSDKQYYSLLNLETGTLPFYTFSAANSEIVKGTEFAELYSLNFERWRAEVVNHYYETYPVYKQIYGQRFIKHELLEEGVAKSTYENGLAVIVNYNSYPIEYYGTIIDANDYVLVEEDW